MQGAIEEALKLLPAWIRDDIRESGMQMGQAEEIRLRCGRKPGMLIMGREYSSLMGRDVSREDLEEILNRASAYSQHSVREQLRQGFLTAGGGIRIGVCGLGIGEGGCEGLRDISSLNIRIPRHVRDVGRRAIKQLSPFEGSVLIMSPPGGGKTTFLRELIRSAADSGRRVAVCDERGELAAARQGRCGFDLGRCCDVMTGVEKAEGMMMLLRAMNPQTIAVDEISRERDMEAIERAVGCGVAIFATLHASGIRHMKKRPAYARLLDMNIFEKAVVISVCGGEREYEVVELCQ